MAQFYFLLFAFEKTDMLVFITSIKMKSFIPAVRVQVSLQRSAAGSALWAYPSQ